MVLVLRVNFIPAGSLLNLCNIFRSFYRLDSGNVTSFVTWLSILSSVERTDCGLVVLIIYALKGVCYKCLQIAS